MTTAALRTFAPLLDVAGLRANVAMRIPCTEAEGPGKRYALWVQGCPKRCPGCCNPEMLAFKEATWVEVEALVQEVVASYARDGIEGVTFLGGEPFAQAPALAALARRVRAEGLSVMIFSGHTLGELRAMAQDPEGHPGVAELLAATDLLVDGEFERDKLDHDRRWIGSLNQQTHALTGRYEDLVSAWDTTPNTLEIRVIDGKLIVNGSPFLMDKLGRTKRLKPDHRDEG